MGYLGVDVAKESLEDATRSRGGPFPTRGQELMLGWLSRDFPQGDLQLIVEPTPNLVRALIRELAYTLINPAQTAAFARVQGKRAKTDRVDARVLASLGESQQPNSPPPEEDQLKALRRHLEWLEKELQATQSWAMDATLWNGPPQLEEEIKLVREAMASRQERDQEWSRQTFPV